jgi:hypothetical protein
MPHTATTTVPKRSKMIAIQLRVTRAQHRKILERATDDGRTMASYLRILLKKDGAL